ncbi:MAG: 30S ribosomal protein S24e [Desulfurococcales archaeon ex4484_58]|nr:MAG: 30S ribosomal protein S24e [Desulfurococcales archaeon ex4484_58]
MGKIVKIGEYNGEVVEEKYNPLIKRKEVVIRIGHVGKSTPSRGLIRTEVSKIYGVEVERTYVRKIKTGYGIGVTVAYIHIYDSVERAKKFEPEHIIKRNEYALQALQLEEMAKKEGG